MIKSPLVIEKQKQSMKQKYLSPGTCYHDIIDEQIRNSFGSALYHSRNTQGTQNNDLIESFSKVADSLTSLNELVNLKVDNASLNVKPKLKKTSLKASP